ncbi:hypothetical protein HZS_6795 [Henneguya salminicola]|nr:hypothetical protein HZS_6795 [Henneguya salminicola]
MRLRICWLKKRIYIYCELLHQSKKYHISSFNFKLLLQKIELLTIIIAHQILWAIKYVKSLLTHEDTVDNF